jgi:hypothetical protein
VSDCCLKPNNQFDFCSISGSGSVDVSVSGVTFDVGISLGKSTNANITKVHNFDVIEAKIRGPKILEVSPSSD